MNRDEKEGLKKISDLKSLVTQTQAAPLLVAEDIQYYIDELVKMEATLNQSAYNEIYYKIDVKPIIQVGNEKINDIEISLTKLTIEMALNKEPAQVLFNGSTNETFYKFAEISGYERMTSPARHDLSYRQTEEVNFHNSFYPEESKLFKEIVEDFIVTAFIKNEKLASTKEKFQELLKNKSVSSKKTM